MKQKETLHLLTLGLHVMTQKKFVTRILFIFHKSLMIPATPAEWPMYMEMIQNLPMFVSHMYIVVMHLTAVSSYIYVPTWHFDRVLRVEPGVSLSGCKSPNSFYFVLWITLCFLYIITMYIHNIDYCITCKCKESCVVIKLQMAYARVGIKSRKKL